MKRIAGHAIAPWLAAGMGYAAVLLAVFSAVWWPGSRRMYFGWDCLDVYWQDIVFQIDALSSGEWPLWNPYSLLGYPIHREPQTGLFSPINWLLWIAGALLRSRDAWLIQAKVMLSLWIGLLGMHALVRSRTGSHGAGALAALGYVLGGPLLVHKNSALLWPMLYLPWVVLAIGRFVERPTIRRAALLALGLWLCGSAGSPPGFFYALLIGLAFWTFKTACPLRDASRKLRAQARGLLVAAALGCGLLLPIYLPAWQAVLDSSRADRSLAYVLQQPLAPGDLWELFLPDLDANWFTDIYMGALGPLLAFFGLVARAREGEPGSRERWLWLGLAAFFLACALGARTPILPFLAEHVPGFGLFRVAYRYKLPLAFCLALLSGAGAAAALRSDRDGRALRLTLVLAAAWLSVTWSLRAGLIVPLSGGGASASSAIVATLVAVVLGAGVLLRVRAPRLFALLIPLALCDLWIGGRSKIAILQPAPILAPAHTALDPLPGVLDQRYRFFQRRSRHWSALLSAREFSGYTAHPLRSSRFDDLWKQVGRRPDLLAHFNVRYVLDGAGRAAEQRDPAALLRVYGRAERMTKESILERMRQPAPLESAWVDPADLQGTEPLPDSAMSPVDGTLLRYARNSLSFRVRVPQVGIAVLNEAYAPGWEAEVNGRPTPVFRANYLLRAVRVDKGESIVVFRYRPAGWLAGPIGFLLSLGAALLLVGVFPGFSTRYKWKGPARPSGESRGDAADLSSSTAS